MKVKNRPGKPSAKKVEPRVRKEPEPGVRKEPEPAVVKEPKPKSKVILDVVAYARGREAGHKEGFADGIRYIVTLAEENLAKSLNLAGRHALGESGKAPVWWMVTLVKALGVDDLSDDIALNNQREEESGGKA